MKIVSKTALVRNILLMLACALVVAIAYFEIAHRYNFGHFVPYGLHVDALNEDFNIAIPGQTKMYWAEISNFSLLPVRLPACRLGTCTINPPPEYAYAIQRFDERSESWQTISAATRFEFCINPVTKESAVEYPLLLPGSSVKAMSGGAFGAMEPFRKNDKARFLVFRQVVPNADWNTAVASPPFLIDDDLKRENEVQFRIQH